MSSFLFYYKGEEFYLNPVFVRYINLLPYITDSYIYECTYSNINDDERNLSCKKILECSCNNCVRCMT